MDTANSICSKGKFKVPGEKLCPQSRYKSASGEESEVDNMEIEDDIEKEIMLESTRSLLNSTLSELEVSPLKVRSVKSSNKASLGKRKLKQVEEAVTRKIATVLNVIKSNLAAPDNIKVPKEIQTKADDLDYFVNCMKEKIKVSNRWQQLQILTLTQKYWSVRKAAKQFSASKSEIQKVKLLNDQKDIIAYLNVVKRHRISQDIFELIKFFSCDDEHSRQMPGKKDFISIGRNKHMSKKLIFVI